MIRARPDNVILLNGVVPPASASKLGDAERERYGPFMSQLNAEAMGEHARKL